MLSGPLLFRAVAAPVCLAGFAGLQVRAMERVTLRNGVTMDCARHENLGDQVRLYSGHGREFQDVSFLQIVSIDYVPDRPAQSAPKAMVPSQTTVPVKAAAMPPAVKTTVFPTVSAPPVVAAKPAAPAKFVPLYVPSKVAAGPALTAAMTAMQPAFPEMGVHELLQRAGSTYNVDAELLASIIHAESNGNARAKSRYGARGLMQLMPSVGRTYGVGDLYRPEDNVTAGTAFLDALLRKYNDNLPLALAAYNAGPSAVERYHGVPPSARGYVGRVMNEFYRRKVAMGAKPNRSVAPVKDVKPVEMAIAPVQPMQPVPVMKPVRVGGAHGRSIHREWSGQPSFASR